MIIIIIIIIIIISIIISMIIIIIILVYRSAPGQQADRPSQSVEERRFTGLWRRARSSKRLPGTTNVQRCPNHVFREKHCKTR